MWTHGRQPGCAAGLRRPTADGPGEPEAVHEGVGAVLSVVGFVRDAREVTVQGARPCSRAWGFLLHGDRGRFAAKVLSASLRAFPSETLMGG